MMSSQLNLSLTRYTQAQNQATFADVKSVELVIDKKIPQYQSTFFAT